MRRRRSGAPRPPAAPTSRRAGPLRRARSLIPVLVPLTVGAFRRADELAEAMESRGYRGGEGRTRYRELRFRTRDALALCRQRARPPRRGPALKRYAGLVEYDGADFAGWATQPDLRTVEGVLSEALPTVLRQPVKLGVAGRTDAGVHASGQVVSFEAETELSPSLISYKATAVLPKDVALRRCVAVCDDFDARRDATSRTYEYSGGQRRDTVPPDAPPRGLRAAEVGPRPPLRGGESWWREPTTSGPSPPRRATTSASSGSLPTRAGPRTTTCSTYRITADSFLYGMVRTLVGTMLEVAGGKRDLTQFGRLLSGGERSEAGPGGPEPRPHAGRCRLRLSGPMEE